MGTSVIRERAFARSSAYAARVPRGDTANANAPSSFDASFALLLLLSTKRRQSARSRSSAASEAEGHSIRANVGVEFKGVRWSRKASRAGIESEVWAERDDGKSP